MSRDPGEFLPPADVKLIAGGATAPEQQAAALAAEGIPHKIIRGRVVVSRYHVRAWLAGEQVATRRPNLGAVK